MKIHWRPAIDSLANTNTNPHNMYLVHTTYYLHYKKNGMGPKKSVKQI